MLHMSMVERCCARDLAATFDDTFSDHTTRGGKDCSLQHLESKTQFGTDSNLTVTRGRYKAIAGADGRDGSRVSVH